MNRRLRFAFVIIGLLAAASVFGPVVAPYDPLDQNVPGADRNAAPSLAHPLGTDLFRRDVLSRLLYGTRISLSIAALSVLLSITIGAGVGLIAGFAGGAVDAVLMRLVDGALAIPRILLLIVVVTLWQQFGVTALVIVLGITSWFGTSRLVRAEVRGIRSLDYVVAARALGLSPLRSVMRHVLPNALAPILVTGSLAMGGMVVTEAGLSFLGRGVPDPYASLGNMIRDSQSYLWITPWAVIAPGVVVTLAVMAFSFLGDAIQQQSDPRTTGR